MKNILLLGDSVRQNYDEYVKRRLSQIANVYYPNANGRFCQYTLRYLHEWLECICQNQEIRFDIVHFNCGLWDVLRLKGESEPLTPPEYYEYFLIRLYGRIKILCPTASVIFALTTSVIEPGFAPGPEVGERRNSDILMYNQLAQKVFSDLGVKINDLWSISCDMPLNNRSDDVHFDTELGSKMLGDSVIKSIQPYISGEFGL